MLPGQLWWYFFYSKITNICSVKTQNNTTYSAVAPLPSELQLEGHFRENGAEIYIRLLWAFFYTNFNRMDTILDTEQVQVIFLLWMPRVIIVFISDH